MITSQGFGLIAELIAAASLIAALMGLIIRRSQPWLVGVTAALVILVVAVTIIINLSTYALEFPSEEAVKAFATTTVADK